MKPSTVMKSHPGSISIAVGVWALRAFIITDPPRRRVCFYSNRVSCITGRRKIPPMTNRHWLPARTITVHRLPLCQKRVEEFSMWSDPSWLSFPLGRYNT